MKYRGLFLLVLALLIIVMIITFIGRSVTRETGHQLTVVTSIYPYEILVRQLAGDRVAVNSLIPPDASPHTYSPTPGDMILLERAELVITNGLDLEVFLESFLPNIADKHISASDYLTLSSEGEADDHCSHHEQHGHHHRVNPHIWLDPLVLIDIAEGLSAELQSRDPENAEYYERRADIVARELSDLDQRIREEREGMGRISIINFHDAFHYFNRRYDIKTAAVVVESPGREPTPRDLIALGKIIEDFDVEVILLEPQLNPKAAEIIAREHKIKIDTVDPLGSYIKAETISDLINNYWQVIRKYSSN